MQRPAPIVVTLWGGGQAIHSKAIVKSRPEKRGDSIKELAASIKSMKADLQAYVDRQYGIPKKSHLRIVTP